MTNKNIDKLPETYTVSYYNPETEESIDLNQEQLQAITDSSKFKVINIKEKVIKVEKNLLIILLMDQVFEMIFLNLFFQER